MRFDFVQSGLYKLAIKFYIINNFQNIMHNRIYNFYSYIITLLYKYNKIFLNYKVI